MSYRDPHRDHSIRDLIEIAHDRYGLTVEDVREEFHTATDVYREGRAYAYEGSKDDPDDIWMTQGLFNSILLGLDLTYASKRGVTL